MRIIRKCKICNKDFAIPDCYLRLKRGFFCNRNCFHVSQKGKSVSVATQFKHQCKKPKNAYSFPIADKNHMWKVNVGYVALHSWVRRHKGKAEKCKYCHKEKIKGYIIHWANKSHKYLRDLSDWIPLCAKCHKTYDKPAKIHIKLIEAK